MSNDLRCNFLQTAKKSIEKNCTHSEELAAMRGRQCDLETKKENK